MPFIRQFSAQRRFQVVFGLVLAVLFYTEYVNDEHTPILQTPTVLANEAPQTDPFEQTIRRDPVAALIQARERHVSMVKDYECLFVKQELLDSGMSAEQHIEVKFRQAPYSVFMHWVRNPGAASRVIYVKGRWVDEDAEDPDKREQAVCQPGPIARVFLKSIRQPIHGSRANDASRRYIDEFGFRRSLDLLIQYCELARSRNELKLEYRGESFFDGRPTWVLRRTLPYTGEGGRYPDRIAEMHIDKDYRIPVAVYCYSNDDMLPQSLLGKYEYTDIRLDVGLTERDFDPATYGM
jgi:hypothetical protein